MRTRQNVLGALLVASGLWLLPSSGAFAQSTDEDIAVHPEGHDPSVCHIPEGFTDIRYGPGEIYWDGSYQTTSFFYVCARDSSNTSTLMCQVPLDVMDGSGMKLVTSPDGVDEVEPAEEPYECVFHYYNEYFVRVNSCSDTMREQVTVTTIVGWEP